jgi:hypothetical protein
MKTLKKLGGVLVLFVVGVFVATAKKILAFGVVATVAGLLNVAFGRDTTKIAAAKPHAPKPMHQAAQPPNLNAAAKVAGPIAPAPSSGPALTPSAPLGAGPIQAARNAAAAQNAQLSKETGQDVPGAKGARPAAPAQATAPMPAQQAPAPSAPAVQQGTPTPGAPNNAASNANSVDSPVMRESFDYTRDARRDPFVSLMTTSDLRPTLTDLRLTGILYDLSGRRPVAILRDIAGGQWRVTTGMTLGRMRVAQIKPKTIIFTIEEFGFNRQDSLILGDTTRVRHR